MASAADSSRAPAPTARCGVHLRTCCSCVLSPDACRTHQNPHPQVENFRGNVQSRIRKLSEGVCSATLLAYAGLKRLDLTDKATAVLEFDEMLPAVSQVGLASKLCSPSRSCVPSNQEGMQLCGCAVRVRS